MNITDKVSVVVINYNGMPWLPEAVESVLRQDYGNLEIIVVDDGSSDESWNYLLATAASTPQLKILRTPHNLGIGGTRNLGIEHATGEYIAFLDSDDLFLPNTISADLRDFTRLSETRPNLALLMTDAWVISEKGRIAGRYMPRKYWGQEIADKAPNWTLPSTWFLRRRWSSSFFAPYRFGESSFFVEHVRRNHDVAFVGRVGIKYRLRMHSATNDDAKAVLTAIRATQQTLNQKRLDNPVLLTEVESPTPREINAWRHGRTAKCAYVNGLYRKALLHGLLAAVSDFPRFCKRAWRTVSFRR